MPSNPLELNLSITEGPPGPPVIFLHGLFGSWRIWQPAVKQISPLRKTIAADLRNHGDSPHHPVHTIPAMAMDLEKILEKLLEPAILVGHSMGGFVAMYLALTKPELVGGIFVIDVAPRDYENKNKKAFELYRMDPENFRDRRDAEERASSFIADPVVRRFLLTNLVRTDGGFRWRINVPALDTSEYISRNVWPRNAWDGPALFLMGGDSYYAGEDSNRAIERYFPGASIREVAGADHWIHSTHQELFLENLIKFINLIK